ncbi:MMPL family transporter [bacterium]|nr:MMPL family transporter [bacterium]
MGSLPRFALRHPVLCTCLVLALPLLAAPGLGRLELRTDGRALVPDSPEAITAERLRAEFGFRDPVVVLLRSRYADGIFQPDALRALRALTDTAKALAGPDSAAVTSLVTESGDRFRPGTLQFRGLLEPWPETPEEMAERRSDVAALAIYDGTLVSLDGTAATVLLPVPEAEERTAFVSRVARAVRVDADSLRLDVVGAPAAEALLGTHLLDDLRRLLPIVLLLIALLFAIRFRSAPAVALPLVEIGACLVVVLGISGWAGVPVYLTTAVLPVILSTIAIADEAHVLTRLAQIRREVPEASAAGAVRRTMDEMASPLTKTSLTTAIGFLSFAISDLAPVRAFGILAAVGILYCLVFSLTVVPVVLALSGRTSARGPSGLPPWILRGIRAGRRRRSVTLAVAAFIVAIAAAGALRLRVQDSWIGGFAKGSAFRDATEFVDEQFLGSHLLRFVLRAGGVQRSGSIPGSRVAHHEVRIPATDVGDPEPLAGARIRITRGAGAALWTAAIDSVRLDGETAVVSLPSSRGSPRLLLSPGADEMLSWRLETRRFSEPRILLATEGFEEFLRAQRGRSVGGALGPATFLKTTRFIVTGRSPDWRSIPRTPYEIDRLWANYARIRGNAELGQLVAEDGSAGVVTAYLRHANFVDTAALLDSVRAYEREQLAPQGIRIELGGDIAVSQALISAIVGTQVRSLLIALLGILAITTWLNRSIRWGFLCVMPSALAVLVVFAGMGVLGIPLGVATSMFAGMCLGIGVDFAIHFVDRFRRTWAGGAAPVSVALDDAAHVAGPAILLDALVVAMGFGVMTLSSVPLNAQLGIVAVLCVVTAMFATILLLPALLPTERNRSGG